MPVARGSPTALGPGTQGRMNQSLHRGLIEIARQCNAALDEPVAHQVFTTLLRLSDRLGLPPPDEIELYGAGTRALMAERFAPVRDWVMAQDGAGPLPDAEEIRRLRPFAEADVTRQALAAISALPEEFPAEAREFLAGLRPDPTY
jgi:hypothetical protein